MSKKRTGQEHVPQRTCIATRQTLPREDLLRFVLAPDGRVVFDLKGSLPGRGAWLAPERAAFEEALRRRAFSRAFKAPAQVPPDLHAQVLGQLRRAALDALSLARKAGEATFGFEKVRQALKRGEVAVLIAAHDGARDGRSKLAALKKALESDIPVVETFSAAELGLAFDRERVIHAAIRPGGLARKFLRLADKLARLQTDMETNEQ